MVKTKTRKHRKLKKRRKSRKRIKTRRRRKLKYRGGGKNDELICHIIKLIESIPDDKEIVRQATAELERLAKADAGRPGSTRRDEIRQQKIRQQDILWKEAGVEQLRKWANKFWSSFCSKHIPLLPVSDSQDSESDEDEDEDEYKNRKPPPPP